LSVLAVTLSIVAPASIFSRVLFGWHAVGSAFGPVLVLILAGFSVDPKRILWSIWIGFAGTVILHWFPNTPGDWLERLLPLGIAAIIAISGSRKD
jgi:sodium/proline symporter